MLSIALALCTPSMERLGERSIAQWSSLREMVERPIAFPSLRELRARLAPYAAVPLHEMGKATLDSLWVVVELLKDKVDRISIGEGQYTITLYHSESSSMLLLTPYVAEVPARVAAAHEMAHLYGHGEAAASLTECFSPLSVGEGYYRKHNLPTINILPLVAPFLKKVGSDSEGAWKAYGSGRGWVAPLERFLWNGNLDLLLADRLKAKEALPLPRERARAVATAIMLSISSRENWVAFPNVWKALVEALGEAHSWDELVGLLWEKLRGLAAQEGLPFDAPRP